MVGEIDFGALRAPDFFGNALRSRAIGLDEAAQASQQRQAEQQSVSRAATLGRYAGGDTAGAQSEALSSGDLELSSAIGKMNDQQRAEAGKRAETLASVGMTLKKLPYGARRQQLEALSPQLAGLGLAPEQLVGFDPTDANIDAQVGLALGIKGQLDSFDIQGSGDEVLVINKRTGQLERRYRGARTTQVGDGGSLVEIPGAYGDAPSAASGDLPGPDGVTPSSAPSVGNDAIWHAVKMQESGGDGNAVGPQTPYGQAQGSTQMLMPTAEGMARKLGVPWRPDLMRGDTPRALAYQDQLGRAYFEEGLQKYGGDVSKALAYYHGGPKETLWGPKTQNYVQEVLGRVGGDAQPYQVASAGETPPPPPAGGARVLFNRPKAADAPSGYRRTATGDLEYIPGGPADPTMKPEKAPKLSATALNLQNGHLEALQTASAINTRLDRITHQLDSGELDLGPAKNLVARGQNAVGLSSGPSRAFASFRADLEKMRNDSLKLTKGVQTEGDAQRAWNELVANLNDPQVVRQRLQEIEGYNQQAIAFHKDSVDQLRDDAGLRPIDTNKFLARPLPTDGQGALPPQAAALLKAGHITTFANGQSWTLRDGKPARLR